MDAPSEETIGFPTNNQLQFYTGNLSSNCFKMSATEPLEFHFLKQGFTQSYVKVQSVHVNVAAKQKVQLCFNIGLR